MSRGPMNPRTALTTAFFHFYDERDQAWPRNAAYDGWWGHDTLPKLNYENSDKLVEYILNVARSGCPCRIPLTDGVWMWQPTWATPRNTTILFWRRFRQAVKEVNPDVLILGRALR